MKKHTKFKQVAKEEKKSKTGLYMSLFLAVVMVGGVAGLMLYNPEQTSQYSYGKYKFAPSTTQGENTYSSKINGKEYSFYFVPQQVSNINISAETIQQIKNSTVLSITFDASKETNFLQATDIFRFEFAKLMFNEFPDKQLVFGVINESSKYDFPIITCDNATQQNIVMLLQYSNETQVSISNNCIIFSAIDPSSMLEELDNLRFNLLGVYNEKIS